MIEMPKESRSNRAPESSEAGSIVDRARRIVPILENVEQLAWSVVDQYRQAGMQTPTTHEGRTSVFYGYPDLQSALRQFKNEIDKLARVDDVLLASDGELPPAFKEALATMQHALTEIGAVYRSSEIRRPEESQRRIARLTDGVQDSLAHILPALRPFLSALAEAKGAVGLHDSLPLVQRQESAAEIAAGAFARAADLIREVRGEIQALGGPGLHSTKGSPSLKNRAAELRAVLEPLVSLEMLGSYAPGFRIVEKQAVLDFLTATAGQSYWQPHEPKPVKRGYGPRHPHPYRTTAEHVRKLDESLVRLTTQLADLLPQR